MSLAMTQDNRLGRLPDPEDPVESAYYDGVLSKRLVAWIIDGIIVTVIEYKTRLRKA